MRTRSDRRQTHDRKAKEEPAQRPPAPCDVRHLFAAAAIHALLCYGYICSIAVGRKPMFRCGERQGKVRRITIARLITSDSKSQYYYNDIVGSACLID